MDDQISQFYDNLQTSGLMTADEVEQFQESLPQRMLDYTLDEVIQEMIRHNLVTGYQVAMLSQGELDELRFGDYIVLEKLATTERGEIYQAQHIATGDVVAIKTLTAQALGSQDAVARFQREMKTLTSLDHPGIVKAIDYGQKGDISYLVLEFVEGMDLAWYINRHGPLPPENAIDAAAQVADALAYVHKHGIVHRDIEPGNLLMDDKGNIKIGDLGLARVSKGGGKALTQADQFLGDPSFTAPEQAQDAHSADHRADIYSLGCTLFYLITGVPVFRGRGAMEVLEAHVKEPVPQLREYSQDAPGTLQPVLECMLAKKRDYRYASASEVAHDLRIVLETCDNPGMNANTLDLKAFRYKASDRPKATASRKMDGNIDWAAFAKKHRLVVSAVLFFLVAGGVFIQPLVEVPIYRGPAIGLLLVAIANIVIVLTNLDFSTLGAVGMGILVGGFFGFVAWYMVPVVPEFSEGIAKGFQVATGIPMHGVVVMMGTVGVVAATLAAVFGGFGRD